MLGFGSGFVYRWVMVYSTGYLQQNLTITIIFIKLIFACGTGYSQGLCTNCSEVVRPSTLKN